MYSCCNIYFGILFLFKHNLFHLEDVLVVFNINLIIKISDYLFNKRIYIYKKRKETQ